MNTLNNNLDITRGTIVMVDLPLGNGSVQGGTRPAVVISNDRGNKFSPVLIVVPLTSRTKKLALLLFYVYISYYGVI